MNITVLRCSLLFMSFRDGSKSHFVSAAYRPWLPRLRLTLTFRLPFPGFVYFGKRPGESKVRKYGIMS